VVRRSGRGDRVALHRLELQRDRDRAEVDRVMAAMMQMKKLDIGTLRQAAAG
jgi:hypothetical protein